MDGTACHLPGHSNKNPECHANPRFTSMTAQLNQEDHHLGSILHHCTATIKGHTSYISSLALAGNILYVGSSDNEIRTLKHNPLNYVANDENLANNVVAVGKGAVKSLVVLADKLFSAHQDHKIRVWKIRTQKTENLKCELIATLPTLGDRALTLLNPSNQVQIRRHKKSTWVHHVDTVSALALSRDESLLYSVSWDRTLKIWRTSDFKCLESISNSHDDAINAVVVSNDGDVYTGSADKKIKVWRKIPGEKKHTLISTLQEHGFGINALALSMEGSVLYSGACDRSILVWEKDNDNNMVVLGALGGHKKAILCLSVALDLIFSGSMDKTIRIWRGVGKHYSCLAVLEGHLAPVKCLATVADPCSRNGRSSSNYIVYSGSLDCDIKVWKIFVPLY
ncbi:hypothetical protein Nepgr_023823 [Nepenthes gracilis]|uniref:Uncharacterized protein n=1 Tax=Nepenthes gracilis TaxID=150966 RepID=A0AAD3T230_NEPGR|nr:hypothetical protein Nepgr_023823 [Nepenthes gracilis]